MVFLLFVNFYGDLAKVPCGKSSPFPVGIGRGGSTLAGLEIRLSLGGSGLFGWFHRAKLLCPLRADRGVWRGLLVM